MSDTAIIINEASECTVKMFIRCAFEQKYRVLLVTGEATDQQLQNAFELIYAQYSDISGLFQTREYEICAYISSLETRIGTIKRFCELERLFIAEFEAPFIPAFWMAKKYGHHLYWDYHNPDKEAFLAKLKSIETKEIRYKIEVAQKTKELVDLRKKQVKKEFTLLESRKEFIASMNRLRQAKFVIDNNETTMEEVALMVRDYRDMAESEKVERFRRKHQP